MVLRSLVLCWLSLEVAAQNSSTNGSDQIVNFCRLFDHRTAIVNNQLFVDGGFVNVHSEGQENPLAVNETSPIA